MFVLDSKKFVAYNEGTSSKEHHKILTLRKEVQIMEITTVYNERVFDRAVKIYNAICKDVTPYDIKSTDDCGTLYRLDDCYVRINNFALMPSASAFFDDGRIIYVCFSNSKYGQMYTHISITRSSEV